jgi:hypothetical protein
MDSYSKFFSKNLVQSKIQEIDLPDKRLPGLCPAAAAPPTGYAWSVVGPGAIPVIGITGLQSPPEILNLTRDLSTVETFQSIALGGLSGGGAKPPGTSMDSGKSTKPFGTSAC